MHRTPADLIRDIRQQRGSDPGPPSVGYQGNRSLEAPNGAAPEEEFGQWIAPELPPTQTGPPVVQFTPPPTVYQIPEMKPSGDYVDLTAMTAKLGKYECAISETDGKAIRTILLKAIRREIADLEKET